MSYPQPRSWIKELNLYKLGAWCWPNESFCDVTWFDRKTSQFIQFVWIFSFYTQNLDVFFPFSSTTSVSRNIDKYAPHTGPKLSPWLLKYTAKQGHNYPVLWNSSQLFLWQIIVRLIWNGNALRFSSKSTIFKQKIRLNCPSTMKFQDRNIAHAHCSIWSC